MMVKIDKTDLEILKHIYKKFESESEITVSSPDYKKTLIDYFVNQGLLTKIDASTLSGWVYIIGPTHDGELTIKETANSNFSKVEAFIEQGNAIMKEEYHHITEPGLIMSDYISGPKSDQWFNEISIFNSRKLINHPLHDQIAKVCKNHKRSLSAHEDMMGYLKALASDSDFWREPEPKENPMKVSSKRTIDQMLADDIERCEEYLNQPSDETYGKKLYIEITSRYDSIISGFGNGLYNYYADQHFYDPEICGDSLLHNLRVLHGKMVAYQAKKYSPVATVNNSLKHSESDVKDNKKVFVVHGHDNEAKQELARVLEKSDFEAIILHEQPNAGKTIIEKIERFSDVGYAIILYTECDKGRDKNIPVDQEKNRARQNVVFEHGYLIAKLGRDRVCALVKGDIETPGDISGVVYVPMDENGAWKMKLAMDMQDVGLPVDMNKFCR